MGKGREAAILRAQHFTKHNRWFLKLDVQKYFDSVPHAKLMHFLERRFKERRLLELLNRIIAAYRWNNDAANCRTANRNTNDPTNRTNNNGFRLALNSAGKEVSALRLQTEQIVFQSEQVLACSAKSNPEAVWCW